MRIKPQQLQQYKNYSQQQYIYTIYEDIQSTVLSKRKKCNVMQHNDIE